jgi:hypothetical protein
VAGRPARGPGQTGAVAERRVTEAPRTRATDSDPPPEPPDREREDDFGDGWRTYRERADHLRQTYGWTVPQPPPRAGSWLPWAATTKSATATARIADLRRSFSWASPALGRGLLLPIPHDAPTRTARRASVAVRSPHLTGARSGLPRAPLMQ